MIISLFPDLHALPMGAAFYIYFSRQRTHPLWEFSVIYPMALSSTLSFSSPSLMGPPTMMWTCPSCTASSHFCLAIIATLLMTVPVGCHDGRHVLAGGPRTGRALEGPGKFVKASLTEVRGLERNNQSGICHGRWTLRESYGTKLQWGGHLNRGIFE